MFNQKKLISGFSYLFYFLPAALISGPFLSDLIVSILAIFFLFFTFKYKLWSYYNNYFTKFFLIFNIYLVISSIWADNTWQSLKSSIPYIRFLLFSLSIAYLSNVNKNFYKLFFKFLFITLFFLILDSYFQLIFGKNLLNQEINFTTDAYTQTMTIRVSSLFGDELILGSYVSRTVFILLGFYLYFKNQVNNFFFILFIMSAFIIIFISGERLAFFIMIFCSIYLLIEIKNYRKFIISISLAVIFIISLITLFNENIKNRMILSSFAFLNPDYKEYYKPPENFVIFSPDHHELYVAAYKMFLNKPILGYGHDMYSQNCNDFKRTVSSCSTHPHNILLQIGVENGIIGLLFLFIVYFYLFTKFIKNFLKKNTEINKYFFLEICLLSIITANLFPFITSGNFFNNWMSIIFYLPVALYLSISTKKNFRLND